MTLRRILIISFLLLTQSVLASNERTVASTPDETVINHPSAKADGLTRIDADGNYIYDTEYELGNQSVHLHLGMVNNPQISVEITQYNTNNTYVVDFDTMYDRAQKLTLGFDYEYFFVKDIGKLGVQAGLAVQYAAGKGRLASDPTKESVETFSFVTMPLFLGATYRFEYKDRQYLAPYLSGGGTYTGLMEKRDDNEDIRAIGSFGYYGAAGVLLNVTAFSREMAAEFRSEYSISNFWINAEFRTVQVASEAFNYDNSFIQGGISLDF